MTYKIIIFCNKKYRTKHFSCTKRALRIPPHFGANILHMAIRYSYFAFFSNHGESRLFNIYIYYERDIG